MFFHAMYSVSFIFEPGEYDTRFHELNAAVGAVARATPGFLGAESWRSTDGTRANAVYYWESLDALRTFSMHPQHAEAKRAYRRWYRGYRVVVAQVLRSYGDGGFHHFTPNERAARPTHEACA